MNRVFAVEAAACAAALIFYVAMLATQKGRREKVRAAAGALVLKTASPSRRKSLALWAVIPLVLALALLVNYSAPFVLLVCALCSLAVYISCRDDACARNNGIYENGLIGGGEYIPYAKIRLVESADGVPESLVLRLELADSRKVQIQFADAREFKCALEQIGR